MTKIFVAANDTYTHASTNTGDTISGNGGGRETVVLQGNPTGTILDGNFEVVQVATTAANTTLQVNATTGRLELVSGGTVFATFSGGLNQAVNMQFTDGDVTLTQTGANAFTIATPGSTTGAVTINPTTPSVGSAVTLGADRSTAGTTTAPVAGQTFALTSTSGDVFSGGSGNDTFTATNATYQAGDVIVGGEGTDTLNVAATGAVTAAATVTGVENVNFNMTTFPAVGVTIDANNITGTGTTITVNNLQAGGSTGVDLDNVSTGATVVAGTGVTGKLAVETEGSITIQAGSATAIDIEGTAATTDSATISGVGTIALDTNAGTVQVENLTLSGNGAAVTYDLNAEDAPETITFTGSQSVTLIAGAVELDTEVATDSTTAGTTTIKIDANDTTARDLSKLAVDVIDVASTTTGGVYTVANNQAVKLSANAAAVTLSSSLASGPETLNLTVGVSQTGATKVEDYEVLNLVVDDGATTTGTITLADLDGSDTSGSVINVSGADNLTLSGGNSAFLNASALTGKLTATLATDLLKVTGGSGGDVITAADVNFTVDGGAGNDTLVFTESGAADLSDNTVSISNVEVLQLDDGTPSNNTVKFKSSAISGETFNVTGSVATDTKDILSLTLDATTLDLSRLTVDDANVAVTIVNTPVNGLAQTIQGSNAADTLTSVGAGAVTMNGNAGNDAITTAAGADVIDGGAGNDVIVTGDGADTITAGEGADKITAGNGIDTINLTETAAATDTLEMKAILLAANRDVVTGFTAGATNGDVIQIGVDDTSVATAHADAPVLGNVAAKANSITLGDVDVAEFSFDAGAAADLGSVTDGSELLKAIALSGSATLNVDAVGDKLYLLAYDAGNAYLYHAVEGADDGAALAAADINLVGVFNGVAVGSMVVGNFDLIA